MSDIFYIISIPVIFYYHVITLTSSLDTLVDVTWRHVIRSKNCGRIPISPYSATYISWTVGNALVIKYFAFSDASNKPGSRYVIGLAGMDFVLSILIPGYIITGLVCFFVEFYNWPFGEVTCHIVMFFPFLIFATPWLLLAISLERARIIFRPFDNKL